MNPNEQRVELAGALAKAAALPHIQIEMPVNLCPDDDPPGENPTETVWARDLMAEADAILSSAWLARVKREAAAEALEQYATEMSEWYPEDIWPPLTDVDQRAVNDALAGRTTGTRITRDRISAHMLRRAAGLARARAAEIRAEAQL